MSTDLSRASTDDEAAWARVRTIIVPTGIAPVTRTSAVAFRKRTPLRKHPDGEPLSRAGGREWFSDRLFVEGQRAHKRAGITASVTMHVIVAIVLMAAVLLGAEPAVVVTAGKSLAMPVVSAMTVIAPPAAAGAPAPIESPADITPESGAERGEDGTRFGVDGGVEGGAHGGVDGGVATGASRGTADGVPGSSTPPPASPIRSVKAPRT